MMNTVRKSENLLPFPVISAAANGDTTAMCAILKHYEGYIAKLCTRTLKDDAGNTPIPMWTRKCVTGCKCALLPAPLLFM